MSPKSLLYVYTFFLVHSLLQPIGIECPKSHFISMERVFILLTLVSGRFA